jgi:uncharacterized membrane protein/predicted DsbA family dithiol-disulfide isomerase
MKNNKPIILNFMLAALGVYFSYLALETHASSFFGDKGSAICNISALLNCQGAIASKWSIMWGRPIAIYGLVFYGLISIFSIIFYSFSRQDNTKFWSAQLTLGFFASLYSLFLLYVSIFEIKSICPVCFATYLVNFSILGLAYYQICKVFGIGLINGLILGVKSLLMLPIDFFRVWAVEKTNNRLIAVCGFLAVLLVIILGDILPSLVVQRIRAAHSIKDIEFPWPKASQKLDGLKLDGSAFSDYYEGDISAPIQVVEYFDYQCPACKYFYTEVKEMLKEYEGKYLWVYRNYPLDGSCNEAIKGGHQHACYAANFVRCAGEQGKFKEINDYILSLPIPTEETTDDSFKDDLTRSIQIYGLDKEALDECIVSNRQIPSIQKDIEEGNKSGLQGTPTLIINGRNLKNITTQALEVVFKDILKRKS